MFMLAIFLGWKDWHWLPHMSWDTCMGFGFTLNWLFLGISLDYYSDDF